MLANRRLVPSSATPPSSTHALAGGEAHRDAVIPRRAPRRRLTTGVLASAVVLALALTIAIQALATAPAMQWSVFAHWVFNGVILHGALDTVWLTLACEALAIVSGIVVAFLLMSKNPIGRAVAHGYQWGFRSVPELAQLLFWFNLSLLFPTFSIGIPFGGPAAYSVSMNVLMTPWVAAILGLGLHEGAYLAEVFRAGVLSVDPGQREAARSLGVSRRQIALQIILPQAMRSIGPNAGSRLIGTLKLTSLASIIAIPELLYRVENVYSRTFETIPLLLVATVWYMLLVGVLRLAQAALERRYGQRAEAVAASA
jgi:polar amino acid transport system permease protein